MAALDELQGSLGFTDAGIALDQDPLAVDVDQNAVDGDPWRKLRLQPADQFREELAGGLVRHDAGDPVLKTFLHQHRVRLKIVGENDGRDLVAAQPVEDLLLPLLTHEADVLLLCVTDQLNAVIVEMREKARQRKRRTAHVRNGYDHIVRVDLRDHIFEMIALDQLCYGHTQHSLLLSCGHLCLSS